jgi:acyl carrier protein phosphodiesterase
MNFLAHLYLSRHSEKLMVGNFIADGVKGKKYLLFEKEIASGILMHRAIDTFTDQHPVAHHSKSLLREKFGLLSGVIIDVFYDHFLAVNWQTYSDESLEKFTTTCYAVLFKNENSLPERNRKMLFYMSCENWLLSYADIDGIRSALTGMSRRIKFENKLFEAADELEKNYNALKNDFTEFFPQLISHVKGRENLN